MYIRVFDGDTLILIITMKKVKTLDVKKDDEIMRIFSDWVPNLFQPLNKISINIKKKLDAFEKLMGGLTEPRR